MYRTQAVYVYLLSICCQKHCSLHQLLNYAQNAERSVCRSSGKAVKIVDLNESWHSFLSIKFCHVKFHKIQLCHLQVAML